MFPLLHAVLSVWSLSEPSMPSEILRSKTSTVKRSFVAVGFVHQKGGVPQMYRFSLDKGSNVIKWCSSPLYILVLSQKKIRQTKGEIWRIPRPISASKPTSKISDSLRSTVPASHWEQGCRLGRGLVLLSEKSWKIWTGNHGCFHQSEGFPANVPGVQHLFTNKKLWWPWKVTLDLPTSFVLNLPGGKILPIVAELWHDRMQRACYSIHMTACTIWQT